MSRRQRRAQVWAAIDASLQAALQQTMTQTKQQEAMEQLQAKNNQAAQTLDSIYELLKQWKEGSVIR